MIALALAAMVGAAPLASASPPRQGAQSAIVDRLARWRPLTIAASHRFGVPEDWIVAVIAAESGGRTHLDGKPITSRAGAMGLMQLMPATWRALRARYGLGDNPYAARDNILAGTAYLRLLYDRFGYPGVFGAYNAGPARYIDYLHARRPLPAETRTYMRRLANRPATSVMPPATLSGTHLFFALDGTDPAAGKHEDAPLARGELFVAINAAPFREPR